jgi:hypothetical protein
MDFEERVLPSFGIIATMCSCKKLTPARPAIEYAGKLRGCPVRDSADLDTTLMTALHFPAYSTPARGDFELKRRERTGPTGWRLNAGASAVLNELPRVALKIDGRSALARCAASRRAVVLTSQGDAVALFFVSGQSGLHLRLGQRRCYGHGGESRGYGPAQKN